MATLDLSFTQVALPGAAPALEDGEAHVWRIALDRDFGPWRDTLSAEEQARAAAMKHEGARSTFQNARLALRLILGAYTGLRAAELPIAIGERGKPYLDLPGAPHFNLSHTGDLAIVGVTKATPVGVDVERIRAAPRLDNVAARFFAPGEIAALQAMPEPDRVEAFHAIWTCKEAFVKAQGTGIANAFAAFEVSVSPREARLLSVHGDDSIARRYTLHAFRPAPDVSGAICLRLPNVRVRGFELAH